MFLRRDYTNILAPNVDSGGATLGSLRTLRGQLLQMGHVALAAAQQDVSTAGSDPYLERQQFCFASIGLNHPVEPYNPCVIVESILGLVQFRAHPDNEGAMEDAVVIDPPVFEFAPVH